MELQKREIEASLWIAGVSAMSAVLASLAGLLPWYMWAVALIGLFSFFMAIRQTWFPDGFLRKRPAGLKKERPELSIIMDNPFCFRCGTRLMNKKFCQHCGATRHGKAAGQDEVR